MDYVVWGIFSKAFRRSCGPPNRSVGPTDRSTGLLVGRTHLSGMVMSLVGGDPRVPISHSDLLNQACSRRKEASYSLGMVSSGRTTLRLALSQAPERVQGDEQEKLGTLRFCNPCVRFSQAPERVKGRVYDMREEKVVLNT
jgi:hypothetical protein